MRETDLAWAAGFIDADGSIVMARNFGAGGGRGRRMHVAAVQVDPAPLRRLQEMFGGALNRSRAGTATHRTQYMWIVDSRLALRCLTQIEPYMVGKRGQAQLAIWFQVNKRRPGQKIVSLLEIAEEEAFSDALRDLHKMAYEEAA